MTDREKLIELLNAVSCNGNGESLGSCPDRQYGLCKEFERMSYCTIQNLANHLIANGVTVQQWIPVAERLPQKDEPLGAICEQVQVLLSDGFVTTGWCNRGMKMWFYLPYGDTHFVGNDYEKSPVIAWQPLAKSPKE